MNNTKLRYLTPRDVQDLYRINVGTLANWRSYGKGPSYIKAGKLVRYKVEVLERWLDMQRVRTDLDGDEDDPCTP